MGNCYLTLNYGHVKIPMPMSVISVLDWWKFVVSIFSWQTYHGKLLQVYASEPFLAEDLPCFQILIIKVDSTSIGPLALWTQWGLFFIHLSNESEFSTYKGMNSEGMKIG